VVLLAALPGLFLKVMCGVIPFVLAGVTIFVCIQRINEIRSGEKEAQGMGADAIVNVRYATSAIMQGAAEVMAYGTAVKFK